MGDTRNLPKASTQLLSSLISQPEPEPEAPAPHRSNMPMLYYGLVVVATAAIVLAVYNLIVVRWCATQYRRSLEDPNIMQPSSALSRGTSTIALTSSFRYKKGSDDSNKPQLDYDMDCSVCLSVFQDGEEVTKLPICSHSFHASCIDMWLNSHFDCPLCRAPVVAPQSQHVHAPPPEHTHTRDRFLEAGSSST